MWVLSMLAIVATILSWLPRLREVTWLRALATVLCIVAGIVFWMNLNLLSLGFAAAGVFQGATVDDLIENDLG